MFKVIFLHGAVFSYYIVYPSNFQLFFAFERFEYLALLPDLAYLNLHTFPYLFRPWFYIAVRVFSSIK